MASTNIDTIIDPNGDTILILHPKYKFKEYQPPPKADEPASSSVASVANKTFDFQ
jgi:hypothetical protein